MERIEYTEEEIFDTAYWLMNEGFCKGMEGPDIQDELLYAENLVFPDCPNYSFTMIEEDEEEDEEEEF